MRAVVHDLNTPSSADLFGRFDLLYDGGTLEHVFNFPVAIANCMRMLRVGGWLVIHTPANNQCGHGFYQFSPELFYRVFCRRTALPSVGCSSWKGFEKPVNAGLSTRFPDPKEMRRRVQLDGGYPVSLLVAAQKTADVTPFQKTVPLQSDYSAMWSANAAIGGQQGTSLPHRVLETLDKTTPRLMQLIRNF